MTGGLVPPVPARLTTGPTQVTVVTDKAGLAGLVRALEAARFITFDVETTGTDSIRSQLVGIALSVKEGEGFYVPIGHTGDAGPQLPVAQVIAAITPAMTDAKIPKYGHNLKFDYEVLARSGLRATPLTFDTMLGEWLCDPASHSLGLKKLAFVRLGVEMTEIKELIGTGKKQLTMDQVPVAAAAPYAAADVDMTTRLVPILKAELEEKGQTKLLADVEMPLIPILADMEMTGIALNAEHLKAMSKQLEKQLAGLEKKIYKLAGYEFNINSTQQLAEALFEKLGLRPADRSRKTAAGKFSTAADVLEDLRGQHPIVELILEQRELSKLKSTYVDALPEDINPQTGRVHTSYKQTGSVTGRIASEDPNLQNIPIRTELGREVRKAFVAARGRRLVAADYSQIELRVAAHVSKDATLLEAFRRGEDIHAATAAAVLGVPADKITKEQRRQAKCVAAGTLVYSTVGLVPIESLAPGLAPGKSQPINLQVHTDCGLRTATHIYADGRQTVYLIRIRGGLEIACTADHRLRIIDENGDYAWRRAAELRPDNYVAISRGAQAFGGRRVLPQVELPPDLSTTNFRDLHLPVHWTPALARFLGYVASEGYIYHHPTKRRTGSLVIAQGIAEAEVVADMRSVCLELFGERVRETKRLGAVFFTINSSKLVAWLDSIGTGGDSQAKRLPIGLLQAPRSIQVEFLRALFAGDGSLKSHGRALTYVTKSPQLAQGLQHMLLNFGFYFRLGLEYRRRYPDPYYVLAFGGAAQLETFMQTIGNVIERKRRVRTAARYDLSVVPVQSERLRALYPLLHGLARDKAYEVLRRTPPVRLNRARASLVTAQLQDAAGDHPALLGLRRVLELHLDFVPVERIEKAESDVYDLVVPDGHCYVANGFISHNTVNFGVLYGQGPFGLTRTTGFTLAEAENFIKNYFERLPGLKLYIDNTKRFAAERGYVESLLGRRRYFPGLAQAGGTRESAIARARAEREAINAPIQATAADIIKLAMLRLPEAFRAAGLTAKMLLQVHDELVVECPTAEAPLVAEVMRSVMGSAFTLDIPLGVEVRTGKNWEEMIYSPSA